MYLGLIIINEREKIKTKGSGNFGTSGDGTAETRVRKEFGGGDGVPSEEIECFLVFLAPMADKRA